MHLQSHLGTSFVGDRNENDFLASCRFTLAVAEARLGNAPVHAVNSPATSSDDHDTRDQHATLDLYTYSLDSCVLHGACDGAGIGNRREDL